MECIFCKIVSGELPSSKVYEDEDVLALMTIAPVEFGHVLVIPREHYRKLPETPDGIVEKLAVMAKKIGRALVATGEYPAFNLSVNNGKAAGQAVDHLHFHVIPRKEGDGHEPWPAREYKKGEKDLWCEKIRGYLEKE